MRRALLGLALFSFACGDSTPSARPASTAPERDGGGTRSEGGSTETPDGGNPDVEKPAPSTSANLRVMAANTTSGSHSSYDPGEGIRMFEGLRPDVALIQELNYKSNSTADIDSFVTTAFGADYKYYRETGAQIPNAIVSRFPILASGTWTDPEVDNRSFTYAKLDVPGPHDLWAVSVHFYTGGASERSREATTLVAELEKVVTDGDFIVIGGDLNTRSRSEPCMGTLGKLVESKTVPVDQEGNDNTNGPRSEPYDWVLPSPELDALQVPTVVGQNQFPVGLVFDSRVYMPLGDVDPIRKADSAAENMQHMPVVKDFALPE